MADWSGLLEDQVQGVQGLRNVAVPTIIFYLCLSLRLKGTVQRDFQPPVFSQFEPLIQSPRSIIPRQVNKKIRQRPKISLDFTFNMVVLFTPVS